ncbi:hypothetical protein JKF63_00875 [Porcisia hertigi]|uniref:Uncharacterized protein n=1 Tax=Porcisia hertigi TaxID=2761500 RepID=A0A836IAD9_9TRYP|nr:hypothetical protein JKF63_00875 [Porcisia hertigi]
MSEIAAQAFNSIPFYKGYLPHKEAQQAQSFVVLALTVDNSALFSDDECFATCSVGSLSLGTRAASAAPEGFATGENMVPGPHTPLLRPATSPPLSLPEKSLARPNCCPSEEKTHVSPTVIGGSTDSSGFPTTKVTPCARKSGVAFYLFHKRDVQPPPIRFYVSPTKVHHCFRGCEKSDCSCDRIHFRPGAWRMRVDTFPRLPLTVSRAGYHVRLAHDEIEPTAGYFFALGLKAAKVLSALVPTMCRFNKTCRNGIGCLYIHATNAVIPRQMQASGVSLRECARVVMDEALSKEEVGAFYEFLDGEGVRTVGDMQVLGNTAFNLLATRVPPKWAEAFLILSAVRDLDTKTPLQSALLAFPRIETPVVLPGFLKTVGDLRNLTASVFSQLQVSPFVMNACSLIRARYSTDEAFTVLDLKKEHPNSFFMNATRMIQSFCRTHAHCSWRKNDPTRPVVTSVLTFVDVNKCHCHCNGDNLNIAPDERIVEVPLKSDVEEMGTPSGSWCQCTRRGVIAVNYELSTPSGSRCSEQNAMGKLASLGVPTWGVREVFVHGMSHNKEANPLFPCGVCENMLQKVTKDVLSHYGGDVTLYMFDATIPRKIVFLTIPEISNRGGANFRRFVAEDLRDP